MEITNAERSLKWLQGQLIIRLGLKGQSLNREELLQLVKEADAIAAGSNPPVRRKH